MNIDISHLEANIRRFHKSSTSLAMKASGVTEDRLSFYPIIIGHSPEFFAYVCEKGKIDSDYFTPFIVNAAFTLEMLLKAIIFYENDKWETGHDLIKLYQEVSTKSKRIINPLFKEHCKKNIKYKSILKRIKNDTGIQIKWNMVDILKASSCAFESWRYAFDTQKTNSSFIGYGEAFMALSEVKNQLLDAKT